MLRRRNRGRGHQRPRLPQRQGTAATAVVTRQPAPPGARRKTVLVVEDNATVGGLMVALLREEGYRALRAWDSREAVRIARDRRPDLILMDLGLPYAEGVDVLQELKSHPETGEAPIIVISGNTLQLPPEQRDLLAECISKPVDIDRFVNYVRRAVGDPELDVPEKNYNSTVDQQPHPW